MKISTADTRRDVILNAALEAVSRYGYRRTSMDDIAKSAGISRPALYQQFANKADIYRGVIDAIKSQSLAAAETAFASDGSFVDRLRTALHAVLIEPHRMVASSPHGEEMLELNNQVAADEMAAWRDDKHRLIEQAALAEPNLDAAAAGALATVVTNFVYGMKANNPPVEEMEKQLEELLVIVSGLLDRTQNSM